jgi:ATP-dependent DNA helicase RecG
VDQPLDWLDEKILKQKQWPCIISALKQVHSPSSVEDLSCQSPARRRIAFEEMASTILRLRVQRSKEDVAVDTGFVIKCNDNWINIFQSKILSFELTPSQKYAIGQIRSDLEADHRMVRLLQGDVGTGKTVVAAHAVFHVTGAQQNNLSVVLAPTEVLVEQHFNILSEYFQKIENYCRPVPLPRSQSIVLLSANSKNTERQNIVEGILNGSVKVVVGTHALLSDEFISTLQQSGRLGLVIIDEEQRFGVNQRDKLAKLSNVLFTTATPIPRSLSLV